MTLEILSLTFEVILSYSKYPSQIDSSLELPPAIDNVTPVKAEVINRLRDAILAVENELGADPSREYGTVRDRLDALAAVGPVNLDQILAILAGADRPISVNNQEIINVGDPQTETSAVNKKTLNLSLDTLRFKRSCEILVSSPLGFAYTFSNNTITANENGSIGPIAVGTSILIAGEIGSNQPYNGIYTVIDTGSVSTPAKFTRRDDADTSEKVTYGMVVFIGNTDESQGVILITPDPITLNTTNLLFVSTLPEQISYSAGNGLNLSGTTFSVKTTGDGTITSSGSGIAVGTLNDTVHGNRGNGNLHTVAVAGNPGTSGFIDGINYQLLTQANSNPTANTLVKRDVTGGSSFAYLNLTDNGSPSSGMYIYPASGSLDFQTVSNVHHILEPGYVNGGVGLAPTYGYVINTTGAALTVDAGQLLLWEYQFPINSIAILTCNITADRVDTDFSFASFARKATIKNTAPDTSVIGSDTIGTDVIEAGITASVSISVSGAKVQVLVQGGPGETIQWFGSIHLTYQAR